MEEVVKIIEEALKRKGLSAAAASQLAVGNPALIKNLKAPRGHERAHPFENLKRLADVLDLELYFGPKRQEQKDLDLVEIHELNSSGENFVKIPQYELDASAGPGRLVNSQDVVDYIAVSIDWLKLKGINVNGAVFISVAGDSMSPTISDGSLALIDLTDTDVRNGKVYAFTLDGQLYAKRMGRVGVGNNITYVAYSDNPDYQPILISGNEAREFRISGRVRGIISTDF